MQKLISVLDNPANNYEGISESNQWFEAIVKTPVDPVNVRLHSASPITFTRVDVSLP